MAHLTVLSLRSAPERHGVCNCFPTSPQVCQHRLYHLRPRRSCQLQPPQPQQPMSTFYITQHLLSATWSGHPALPESRSRQNWVCSREHLSQLHLPHSPASAHQTAGPLATADARPIAAAHAPPLKPATVLPRLTGRNQTIRGAAAPHQTAPLPPPDCPSPHKTP